MYEKELELAIKTAKEAGDFLLSEENMKVDSAEGKDIKLSTDKSSEKIIMESLGKESNYPILSEEAGLLEGKDPSCRWIVDPLDGSLNYNRDMKEMTCVSIALWKGETPLLGVIYRYATGELYTGIVGEGAFCNGKAIGSSQVTTLSQGVFATGFPVNRDYGEESLLKFSKQVQQFKKVRMLGTAALMGTFVACGKVDVYEEENIMLWDIAASTALVLASGGEAEVKIQESNQCHCKLFANKGIKEDFHAKIL